MLWKLRYAGHLGLRSLEAPLFRRSAASADPIDQIDFLADQGFAGVQDLYLKLRTPAEQARIGRHLAARGLTPGTFSAAPLYWDKPLWSTTDPPAIETLRRELDDAIEAADRLGGGAAVCVTALDPARPRAVQIDAMVENLRRLAEPAARAGLMLLVEPVAAGFMPGFLVDRLADAAAIVRRVASPDVRLLFDIAHVQTSEGAVLPGLAESWDLIGWIQAADTPGRRDLGAGALDWPAILREIRGRGYNGLIEIEHEALDDTAAGERRLLDRLRAVDAAI